VLVKRENGVVILVLKLSASPDEVRIADIVEMMEVTLS
jgi:hypothetical protein